MQIDGEIDSAGANEYPSIHAGANLTKIVRVLGDGRLIHADDPGRCGPAAGTTAWTAHVPRLRLCNRPAAEGSNCVPGASRGTGRRDDPPGVGRGKASAAPV